MISFCAGIIFVKMKVKQWPLFKKKSNTRIKKATTSEPSRDIKKKIFTYFADDVLLMFLLDINIFISLFFLLVAILFPVDKRKHITGDTNLRFKFSAFFTSLLTVMFKFRSFFFLVYS